MPNGTVIDPPNPASGPKPGGNRKMPASAFKKYYANRLLRNIEPEKKPLLIIDTQLSVTPLKDYLIPIEEDTISKKIKLNGKVTFDAKTISVDGKQELLVAINVR